MVRLLESSSVGRLELERRVFDVEVARQAAAEAIEDAWRLGPVVEHDVR
jgi:hypothetical protein